MSKIKIYHSLHHPNGIDKIYNHISWIANDQTVIAIVSDMATGQIEQYKLNEYTMQLITN